MSLASLVIFGLLLEGFLRVTGIQPPFLYQLDEDVCAIHIPSLQATFPAPSGRLTVKFNQAGYRDRERRSEKAPGALRVELLGDSFVEALQVPLSQTASQVAEERLGKDFPGRRVEVLNLGVSGFGTDCSLMTLRHSGLAYQPDVVVLAFNLINDLYDNHPALAVEPYKPFFEIAPDGSLRLHRLEVRDSRFKRWLRGHSRLFLFIRDRIHRLTVLHRMGEQFGVMQRAPDVRNQIGQIADRRLNNIYLIPPSPLMEQAWEVTEQLVIQMAEELRHRGIPLIVVIIPTIEQLDANAARKWREAVRPPEDRQLDFQLPWRRIKAILERRRLPVVDLFPVFDSAQVPVTDLFYPGDGHWTPLGNRLAGEAIAAAASRILESGSTSSGD